MFAVVSCTKEEVGSSLLEDPVQEPEVTVQDPDEPSGEIVVFSAFTKAVTRTELSDNGDDTYTVLWKTGDQINVNGSVLTLQTEDQPAGYGPGETKGQFSGPNPSPAGSSPLYKAIYPAGLRDRWGYYNLPSEQPYVAGGIEAFPMYAESDTQSLEFHNLCGIIQLNLKGEKSVSAVTLNDTDVTPKPMSGRFTISSNAAVPSTGTNGTALICSTPVALNTSSFTSFFITVPAASYGKLRIIVEASDGTTCTLTANKAITVERSMITPINISSPTFLNETSQITYTTTNTTKVNKYDASADASVFGDGLTVVSHNYNSETRTGVITFSGTVTTIGYYAFRSISNLKTVTIPNTVTSIGERGFGECGNLESVNFPRSLTYLGKQAFVNCSKFVPGDMSHITYIGEEGLMNANITGTLTIWDGLDHIGLRAFKYAKFSEVVFDHTPSELDGYIFESSGSLNTVVFNDDIAIPAGMFSACQYINSVTFNADVTSISERAFSSCKALTSLELPESVTSIGDYAFSTCTSLSAIALPAGLTTLGERVFENCSALASVTLPTGVGFTTIPIYTFDSCSNLTSISIPSNVTNINNYAFRNCGLTTMPEGWGRSGITYGSYVFKGCPITSVTFPDTMTSISNDFFRTQTSLETVVLGSGITSIGTYAFEGCTHLSSVTLNSGLETIGEAAFKNCSALSTLSIPATVRTISQNAFESCGLTSITMPASSVTQIGPNAFRSCTSLGSITLPESLTSLGIYAFYNCTSLSSVSFGANPTITTIPSYCFNACTALNSITLPSSMTTLQNNAFDGCTSLATVVFPTNPSFTTIPQGCFQNCTSLTTANIPSNITTIVYEAFKNCGFTTPPSGWERNGITYTGGNSASVFMGCPITSITFPDNWTSIPNYFCVGWNVLEEVHFGSGVTTIGNNAFQGCASLTDGSKIDVSQITNFGGRCFYKSCLTSLPAGINRSGLTIGEGIFMDAAALTAADLSNWNETPYQCFRGCTNLASVDLSGLTTMGGYAFVSCSNLATVVLGSSLTTIGGDCFNGCYSVDITIHAETPPSVGRLIYSWSNFVPTIHVPAGSVETYKNTSPWSNYAESIFAIP